MVPKHVIFHSCRPVKDILGTAIINQSVFPSMVDETDIVQQVLVELISVVLNYLYLNWDLHLGKNELCVTK